LVTLSNEEYLYHAFDTLSKAEPEWL